MFISFNLWFQYWLQRAIGKHNKKQQYQQQPENSITKQQVMKKLNINEAKLNKDTEYEGYVSLDSTHITEYHMMKPNVNPDFYDRRFVNSYTRIEKKPDGYKTSYLFDNKVNLLYISYFFPTSLEIGIWKNLTVQEI